MPNFQSLEYQARDPENLTILRTCRCNWVRNKDIAEATGMTPAGAKRRNEFLESIGLLERRRRGKEVQYCTTILAYLANLDLAIEEPLAALGVMRAYLELAKPYSMRLLKDLGTLERSDSEGDREAEFSEYKELQAIMAYLWPRDLLSKLWVDLKGFERPGAVLYDVNRMAIPLPLLMPEEYESVAHDIEKVAGELGEGPEGYDIWKEISKDLLTGRIGVGDYRQQKNLITEKLAKSRLRANQHYTVLRRFRKWIGEMNTVGPMLAPLMTILDEMLDELGSLGFEDVQIPDEIPIGMPDFQVIPAFDEEIYARNRESHLA